MSNKAVPASRRSVDAPRERLYGGIGTVERQAERRARFLEAAIVAFGRDGFSRTTTRSLCAEAGLTQRYFYESFASVEELFEIVAKRLGEELEVRLSAAAERAPHDRKARLQSVLTEYFDGMRKDVNAARILLVEVYTAGERSGSLAFRFTAHLASLLRAEIDAASPHLAAEGIDSGLMAAGYIGATHHVALKWAFGRYREPLTTVVATAMRIYLGPREKRSDRASVVAKRTRA
jgi:AcrR family transcriptional regulator